MCLQLAEAREHSPPAPIAPTAAKTLGGGGGGSSGFIPASVVTCWDCMSMMMAPCLGHGPSIYQLLSDGAGLGCYRLQLGAAPTGLRCPIWCAYPALWVAEPRWTDRGGLGDSRHAAPGPLPPCSAAWLNRTARHYLWSCTSRDRLQACLVSSRNLTWPVLAVLALDKERWPNWDKSVAVHRN